MNQWRNQLIFAVNDCDFFYKFWNLSNDEMNEGKKVRKIKK